MDVRCDKCQARYRIDDARVGPQGLAMRCGKCGKTFRVSRETAPPAAAKAAPAKPPTAPPAPARSEPKAPEAGATVMFSAPPPPAVASPPPAAPPPRAAAAPIPPAPPPPPRAPSLAVKSTPSPKAAGAAPAGAALAEVHDEAAGRTMMFSAAATLKTQPPSRTPAGTVKPLSKPTDAAGATLVFGAGPTAAQQPKPKPEPSAGASATILFGAPPPLARPEAPAPLAATPAPVAVDQQQPSPDETLAGPVPGEVPESSAAAAQEATEEAAAPAEAEVAGAPEGVQQAPAWHGPPRALVIAVAAALGLVLLLGGVVLAVKKLGHRAPPQAALDALADASAAADKDTLSSLAEAEAQTNAALQLAPKSPFPQAWAQLAEIQIAWSDALDDQAWYWGEQANRAFGAGDDKKKADSEAKATALQDAAKAHLKTAFEAAATGNKLDPKSPDVALALADYYRAARSRLNLSRELKRAALLKADEARIAFVQGAELLAQDEGGAKALEKLKAALAGSPRSARIRFRMAMAYLSLRQDAEAKKELLATLELSPQHERARMAMELLAPPAATPSPASPEGKRE